MSSMRAAARRVCFLAALLLGAVALPAAGDTDTAAQPDAQVCVPVATWVDPTSREQLPADKLLHRLAKHRVVLLGEHHDLAEHHRWQLQMMVALHALHPDIVLGFEMFPRRVQPVLDRWVNGELTVAEFLEQSEWLANWHYDPELYLSLFHFARMNRIPMYALNVDKQLMSRVRDNGWQSIPEDERQGVTDPVPASKPYLRMLAESFRSHGAHSGGPDTPIGDTEKQAFTRFVETQQLWDRAMAEIIAEQTRKRPSTLFIGVMGTGHIASGLGVPHQLRGLQLESIATLIPWSHRFDCSELEAGIADAVFGLATDEQPAKNKPRLGVLLDQREQGVVIMEVVKDSVAASAGLMAEDVIVEIAGLPAAGIKDVIETVTQVLPGTWLPIKVERGGESLEIVARFPASAVAD